MSAKAKLFALCCLDPRFRVATQKFIERKFKLKPDQYDISGIAGGAGELVRAKPEVRDWILRENIGVGVMRHGVEKILVFNHIDCGFYGGSTAFGDLNHELSTHRMDVMQATEAVKDRYPEIEVQGYLIKKEADGSFTFERAV